MNYFPIKDLKRAEYNPRIMPDADMQSLMKSIETHGFVEPIVVNVNKERYGVIVGGHQRLTAIERLLAKGVEVKGIAGVNSESDELGIPSFRVNLDLEAEKQLNIGLNKIHGKFDEAKLYDLVVEMRESPTISVTGLSEKEISAVLHWNDEVIEKKDVNASICERCNELKLMVQGHSRRTSHTLRITDKDFE